jgi:hypothetical protein
VNPDLPDRSGYRAADADREAVIERLQAAAQDGRLDFQEFEERMAAAYEAKTFGELEPLTADLLDGPLTQAQEVTLHAIGSSLQRRGSWTVPRRLVLKGKAGSSMLDFTQARLLSRDVDLSIDATAGSVTIIVPPGTSVDTSGLRTSFGSTNIRIDETAPTTTAPLRLTLHGTCHMGSVTVRHLSFFERWWRNFRARRRRRALAH